jgi:hypothetical protein
MMMMMMMMKKMIMKKKAFYRCERPVNTTHALLALFVYKRHAHGHAHAHTHTLPLSGTRHLHVPEIVADSPKVHLEDEPLLPSLPAHLILISAVTGKSSHFTAVTSTSKAFDIAGRVEDNRPTPNKHSKRDGAVLVLVDFFFLMVLFGKYDLFIIIIIIIMVIWMKM